MKYLYILLLLSLLSTDVNVTIYDESQYANGYTIFSSAYGTYSAIIDMYGNEIWNADSYSSGMYFVKMIAGKYVKTQKLMPVK